MGIILRPDKYPRYASNDIVDPISGVNNVVEPSEAKKNLGHGPLGEFPPRQYQNWFMRLVYNWIQYFDGGGSGLTPFTVKIDNTDLTIELQFDINWTIIGNIVHIYVPTVDGTSNSSTMEFRPVDNGGLWPDELVSTDNQRVPCVVVDNNSLYLGTVQAPKSTGSAFVFTLPVSDKQLFTGFTASGTKGLQRATFIYRRF